MGSSFAEPRIRSLAGGGGVSLYSHAYSGLEGACWPSQGVHGEGVPKAAHNRALYIHHVHAR